MSPNLDPYPDAQKATYGKKVVKIVSFIFVYILFVFMYHLDPHPSIKNPYPSAFMNTDPNESATLRKRAKTKMFELELWNPLKNPAKH